MFNLCFMEIRIKCNTRSCDTNNGRSCYYIHWTWVVIKTTTGIVRNVSLRFITVKLVLKNVLCTYILYEQSFNVY